MKLDVRTLTINGSILADGERPYANGGSVGGSGSGGSIWLMAKTLDGTGAVQASGANGQIQWGQSPNRYAGAGGGGRIAYYYTTLAYTGSFTVPGGTVGLSALPGDAGTIYAEHIPAPGMIILLK